MLCFDLLLLFWWSFLIVTSISGHCKCRIPRDFVLKQWENKAKNMLRIVLSLVCIRERKKKEVGSFGCKKKRCEKRRRAKGLSSLGCHKSVKAFLPLFSWIRTLTWFSYEHQRLNYRAKVEFALNFCCCCCLVANNIMEIIIAKFV